MIYILLLFVLFLVGIPICFSLGLVSIVGMVQGATPMIAISAVLSAPVNSLHLSLSPCLFWQEA